MIAGLLVLAALLVAALVLWWRSANRSLDRHVDEAIALGNARRHGSCDCGRPQQAGLTHGVSLCAPAREMLP